MKEKKIPWQTQKELQKKYKDEEVPDLAEINRIIEDIYWGKINPERDTLRARALFAMYYLTACRLTEIVIKKYKYVYKVKRDSNGKSIKDKNDNYIIDNIEKIPYDYIGIKKEDISFDYINGREVMYVRTDNRKNKNRTSKKQPIPIELERDIAQYIKDYLYKIIDPKAPLFRFCNKYASKIITESTGFNVHFIRHIRATHLITLYDFNEQHLISFMGWTDARPARHYMELNKKDLFEAFYKNRR